MTLPPKGDRERYDVDVFLRLLNAHTGRAFEVVLQREAPDFECRDSATGEQLFVEVTLVADRDKDIGDLLGRTKTRSLEVLIQHNLDVAAGKAHAFDLVDSPQGWHARLIDQISTKGRKDYGRKVALAIRDASPLEWDIDVDDIRDRTAEAAKTFDRGVWVYREESLYEIWPARSA